MFPEIDIEMETDIEEEETVTEQPKLGRVPLYDFKNREYVVRDGKVVEATEDEAIRQWVAFLILTKKDKFEVYEGTDFGTYIDNYIGMRGNNLGFVASEFEREIEEGCELNPFISGIKDFSMEVDGGKATVNLTVIKKDGTELEVKSDV